MYALVMQVYDKLALSGDIAWLLGVLVLCVVGDESIFGYIYDMANVEASLMTVIRSYCLWMWCSGFALIVWRYPRLDKKLGPDRGFVNVANF